MKNDYKDIKEKKEKKGKEEDEEEIKNERKRTGNSACVCRCDLCVFEHSPEHYLQPSYYREDLEPEFQGNFYERESKLKETSTKMRKKKSEEEVLNDWSGCKNVEENDEEEEDIMWVNEKVIM